MSIIRGDHIKWEKIVNASTCVEITGKPLKTTTTATEMPPIVKVNESQ